MFINTSIYIMRTVICIIYVHDDVDVSAYEYVNVYADGCVNVLVNRCVYVYVYRYLYMHELENEN